MRASTKGTLITLAAGVAWGLSGVSGQFLLENGISVELITVLRLLISGLVLSSLALLRQPEAFKKAIRDKQSMFLILVFGIVGLVLNQLSYLTAIEHSNAGTATVLQYLCPIIVLAYTCLKERKLPTGVELASMALALMGTFLIATHGKMTELAVTPLGLFWGIFSAFTYTAYIILPMKAIKAYGSLTVIGLGMLMGGVLLGLFYQVWTYSLPLTGKNLLGLFGIVGIGTIFAYTVFLEGVSRIGSVKGSLLASIEPVASVFFAVVLIKEVFYPIDLFGMLLILLAVGLISYRDLMVAKKSKFQE
ncbi:drug/metabolite transporter (DMT)-like permease [Streptococcus rupicaprae]|uniref:Drug/metabolite transporter (DMT)-like permease n=1 Tax=Streptococcus rupicaprae TaxID=759619 RepID=A0ABV2FJ97_9STRE